MSRSEKMCVVGPLAGYVSEVERSLLAQGYTQFSTNNRLCWTSQLSRWMLKNRISASSLSEVNLIVFINSRVRVGSRLSRGSMDPIIQCLIDLGAIRRPKPLTKAPPDPIDQILKKFEKYLREERVLKNGSTPYIRVVRRFLLYRFGSQKPRVKAIETHDLVQFILSEFRRYSKGTAKGSVTALRSYFNFLYISGAIRKNLSGAIPAIAGWRMQGIPKGIEPQQVRCLLRAPDRRTHSGRRDFAILLLLVRLGLRRKEVASIKLDDIDWKEGEIKIDGKGARIEKLPLPSDVGKALAVYLKESSRVQAHRMVFCSLKAPHKPLGPTAISAIVSKAAIKVGLPPMGAHHLRHTLATQTLRHGGSLDEIAQVLRHSSHDTTAIYAKVDLSALRTVTQPWPEVVL